MKLDLVTLFTADAFVLDDIFVVEVLQDVDLTPEAAALILFVLGLQ